MKIKQILGVLGLLLFTFTILAATPPPAASPPAPPAAIEASQWVVTLAGSGTSTAQHTTTTFGTELSLGKTGHLILPLEAGLRQGISYASANDTVIASTRAYADWTLITLGPLELAGGANIGAAYGDTSLAWAAGPEAVGRIYLKKDVFVFGRVQYDFALNGRSSIRQTDRDAFGFALGLTARF